MFVLANLLDAVAAVINMGLTFLLILVFARAVISWVHADPYNPIVQFLYTTTEPILRPIRRRLPQMTGIDISPLVVVMITIFLRQFLVRSLVQIAQTLRP
ncbi:MAG: YggT family protein [Acidobacteria bacterium]|nr:YggT family protein [Acidobacteriota bacterium]